MAQPPQPSAPKRCDHDKDRAPARHNGASLESVGGARPAPRSPFRSEAMSTPTATKLNQKPGCNKAHGSQTKTAAQAINQTKAPCHWRAESLSTTTTKSISKVRCAGKPQPLNKAYKVASSKPDTAPTCTAGQRIAPSKPHKAARRQPQPTATEASQANMVTCSPEMLIRWATPVALNTSQSLRSIAA